MSTDLTPTDLTASEFYESLNGFEEIAIRKAFDLTPAALADADQMMFGRALLFVAHKRQGKADPDAKRAALESTNRQVGDYFADEEPEVLAEEPTTESGKGD